jgi:PAS domain S-box-containing protein
VSAPRPRRPARRRRARPAPQAREKLRANEAASSEAARWVDVVISHAPIVLFALDREGVFTLSEGRGLIGLGLKPGQVVGQSVFEVYAGEPALLGLVRRALAGEAFTTEVEAAGRVFETLYEPIRDPDGAVAGVVGVATDVTAHVHFAARLEESEQRFREIAEHIQEVFWMSDPEGRRLIYVSPAFETLFGRPPAAALEDPDAALATVHPDDRDRVREAVEAQRRGERSDIEYRVVRPDGAVRWVRERGFPVHDSSGRVTRVAGITEDVTRERESEAALRNTVARLEATLEATTDGIVVVDDGGRITDWNQRALEMWRVPAEVASADDLDWIQDLVLPQLKDPDRFIARALDVLMREDARSYEVIELKDGRVFERYTLPMRVGERVCGRVLSYRDVTERRRQEERERARAEELRQAQKMEAMGRLAGEVAHDFNNLLTAILGHVQLVLDTLASEDPRRDDVVEIHNAGQRAAVLTRQLLAFGRRDRPMIERFDLGAMLDEVHPMVRAAVGGAVALSVRRGDEPLPVRADRAHLEQALLSLAVNARDAMPEGGSLDVDLDLVTLDEEAASGRAGLEAGPHARLRVRDTGVGMGDEVRARLFEPFFTTKPRDRGSGLGLAMVYTTITQARGHIEVRSAPGQGTTFTILLPLARAGEPEPAAESREGEPSPAAMTGGSETLLLVEDEELVRALLSRLLAGLGYDVRAAGSGAEALEVAAALGRAPDLLVTDVVMPGMNGVDLAAALRRRHPGLQALFISGHADEATRARIAAEPGAEFLLKPFVPAVLACSVRRLLDARGSRRA